MRRCSTLAGCPGATTEFLHMRTGSPHACTTQVDTTLQAAEAALSLLKPGGVLTICVYPGHEEGTRERGALLQWAGALDDGVYDAMAQEYLNIRKKPPLLIAVTKR